MVVARSIKAARSNGKIQSFNCYPSGTVIFAQLGVLSNIEAAVARS
jgi:hypothetical protein